MYSKRIMRKLTDLKLFLIFFSAFIFRFVLSFFAFHQDLLNHADWGVRFWQYGAARFFSPDANVWSFTWPNQPPGTIYIFAGIRKLYEGLFAFFSFLHFNLHIFPGSTLLYLEQHLYFALLKLPAILADLGLGCLIYAVVKQITKKDNLAFWASIIWLINPVVWYNSSVWGQYDSVINFFALLAFYLLFKRKLAFSLLAFSLSLYIKAPLVIFAPIFLVIALGQHHRVREYLTALVLSLVVIAAITLPFSHGEPFSWLFNLYRGRVFTDQLHSISANAFNLWGAVSGISATPELFSETTRLAGLTYQYWGYIVFAIFYLPALWLVFKRQDTKSVVWALAVGAFSTFMLLTNMHERYLYPLFPYFTILLVMESELTWNYVATSLINLLNLYNFWWMPVIPGLMEFMSAKNHLFPRVLAGIGFVLFLLFYLRFVKFNFRSSLGLRVLPNGRSRKYNIVG